MLNGKTIPVLCNFGLLRDLFLIHRIIVDSQHFTPYRIKIEPVVDEEKIHQPAMSIHCQINTDLQISHLTFSFINL